MITRRNFSIRGLSFSSKRLGFDWIGTLYFDTRPIAKVQAVTDQGLVMEFNHEVDRAIFVTVATQHHPGKTNTDACEELLIELAHAAYVANRAHYASLRHTVFRLRNENPETYFLLRGKPVTHEILGNLKLVYGRQLMDVLGTDSLAPVQRAKAEATHEVCGHA